MGHPHGKPAERVGNQPRRAGLQSAKLIGIGDLKSALTNTHGDAEFGGCPAGFYLAQYFHHMIPFLPSGISNIYSVLLYVRSM